MMEDKIELTFDEAYFEKSIRRMQAGFLVFEKKLLQGIDKISDGMTTFNNNFEKSGKGIKKAGDHAKEGKTKVDAMGFGFLKLAGFLNVAKFAFDGIRKAMAQMPELNATFGIMKDVILKNLFWPLRQMVIPYLQKLLDWTRDNRALFIQFGSVIANVFRGIKTIFESMWNLVTSFTKGFENAMNNTFKFSVGSILDFINLAIFKVTAMLLILSIQMKPIFETLGGIFADLLKDIKAFVKGFVSGFTEMDKSTDIIGSISNVLKQFKRIIEDLTPLFAPLGKALGKVFNIALVTTLQLIEATLKSIADLVDLATGKMDVKDFGKAFGDTISNFGKTNKNRETSVKDAIIKPDGSVIHTDPKDTLIASKGIITRNDNVNKNQVSFGDMNITLNVTEGNARSAGEEFAHGLSNNFRNKMLNNIVLQGGF